MEHDVLVNGCAFCECLDLGEGFGWEPMGTIDPSSDEQLGWDTEEWGEWPGSYAANCAQTVREDDARAFSMALFRALDAITGKQLTQEELEALKKDCPDFNKESFLAMVREVAEFAAKGAFQIC